MEIFAHSTVVRNPWLDFTLTQELLKLTGFNIDDQDRVRPQTEAHNRSTRAGIKLLAYGLLPYRRNAENLRNNRDAGALSVGIFLRKVLVIYRLPSIWMKFLYTGRKEI